jgi:CheY-like chemotaxis protein
MKDNTFTRPVRILLVEDNPADVRLTQEALKDAKVKNDLFIARDGEEAVDFLFKREPFTDAVTPDLILLDLNLPKKSGQEVLEEIKQVEATRHIPVVILTTSQAEEDIVKSYGLHANCYVNKPVDFNQFLRIIHSIEDFWLSVVRLPTA